MKNDIDKDVNDISENLFLKNSELLNNIRIKYDVDKRAALCHVITTTAQLMLDVSEEEYIQVWEKCSDLKLSDDAKNWTKNMIKSL